MNSLYISFLNTWAVYFDSKVIAAPYLYITKKQPLCHCSSNCGFIISLYLFTKQSESQSIKTPKLSPYHTSSLSTSFSSVFFYIADTGQQIKAEQDITLHPSLVQRLRIKHEGSTIWERCSNITVFKNLH